MDATSSQGLLCKLCFKFAEDILSDSNGIRLQGRKGGSILHYSNIPVKNKAASNLNTI